MVAVTLGFALGIVCIALSGVFLSVQSGCNSTLGIAIGGYVGVTAQ